MTQLLQALRRFGNDGAIVNAGLEVDQVDLQHSIIEALCDRVAPVGVIRDARPRSAPAAA